MLFSSPRIFVFAIVYFLTSRFHHAVVSADVTSATTLSEQDLKQLGFDLEVMLKLSLRDWRFLTETEKVTDVGDVLLKEDFLSAKDSSSSGGSQGFRCGEEDGSDCSRHILDKRETTVKAGEDIGNSEGYNYHPDVDLVRNVSRRGNKNESSRSRQARDGAKVPVLYMPGGKKKRKCADVNGGMLAGFNTFNYLTFVTGVITLVLNVNNNINNNNNNNNLNNNNDLSNNNVNANTNTQNANQVVIFPPGRKRRFVEDWILQMKPLPQPGSLSRRTTKSSPSGTEAVTQDDAKVPKESTTATCMISDMVFPLLEALNAWTEGAMAMDGECGWKRYCEVLLKYSRRADGPSVVLSKALRRLSDLVASPFASSSECYVLLVRCHLV
ncbi:hybrid signal transduction histidine kinase K-like [Macrobrachium nipponense]|uniref:hybrid signal transduction histidine kinase K-like n=1 Tax=Macrobrachium nipponense TaxID=159736 RepID=UPI0030C8C5CD